MKDSLTPSMKRMLRTLKEQGQMERKAWEKAAYVGKETFRTYLYELHSAGLVHIHERLQPGPRGGHAPLVWMYGPGVDAVPFSKIGRKRIRDAKERKPGGIIETITYQVIRIPRPGPIEAALMGVK